MKRASMKILTIMLVPLLLTGCTGTQRDQQLASTSEPSSTAVSTSASTSAPTLLNEPATSIAPANTASSSTTPVTPAPSAPPSELASASPTATAAPASSAPTVKPSPSSTPTASPATTPIPKPAVAPTASPSTTSTPLPATTPKASPDAAAEPAQTPASVSYPLHVSSNKRYLVDEKGNSFFVFADTGWMLFSNIPLSDAEYYLEYRRSQNVNSILCYAAPFFIDATNKQGELAFLNNDLARPNDKYFEHVDQVIKLAATKGMQVILCPVEMCNYAPYYTIDNARALGRYMGKRYKNYDNILWFTGGDIHPTKEQIEITNSLAAGIRDFDKRHLISFHPGGGNTSSDYFNSQSWLDYNMIQVHAPDSPKAYQLPLADYGKTPVRPAILIETCYEDMIKGNPVIPNSPFQIRRSIAWSILSGGFGVSYGNQILYKFINDTQNDWKATLDHPAFRQTANIVGCISKREWQKLVPDLKHTLLTNGYGTEGYMDYATAALAGDGSFAVIYIPTSREISIDMSQFNGSKHIKWYDPTNNTYTTDGSLSNKGSHRFAARPKNSAGEHDWFLIIE